MNSLIAAPARPVSVAPRRILIVDDHSFFSFCLRTLIQGHSDLAVCDTAPDETNLMERISLFRPHLLVVDLSVGRCGGLDLARRLRTAGICTPILFVSSAVDLPRHHLLAIPGSSFACKGGDPSLLIRRMRRLLARVTSDWPAIDSAVA